MGQPELSRDSPPRRWYSFVVTQQNVRERAPLRFAEIRELIGEDAAETLDSALDGLLHASPVFEWPEDLKIDGDTSSRALLAHLPGFEAPPGAHPPDTNYTIVVRGNLTISGTLEVVQYHDLYVLNDLHARSISSHTGNLVVAGRITASEVIAFECNEEGGVLHGASCTVPLLCRFSDDGGGPEWAVENEGPMEHWERTPGFEALEGALARLGVDASFRGLRDLVRSGRATELLEALAGK